MKYSQPTSRRRGTTARWVAGSVLLPMTVLGACSVDEILRVEDPDVVRIENLTTVEALPAVFGAVLSEFQLAFSGSGGTEGLAQMGGLFTDELLNAESFPTRIEVDKRQIDMVNGTMLGIYRTVQRARATAETASDRFATLDPTNARRPEVLSLGGYTYILIAENYCSGVPFSTVNADGSFSYGPSETTTEALNRAIAKFDSAIALTSPSSDAGRLARVGKARALLNLNQPAAAAAVVTPSAVPTSFRYQIEHSDNTARQYNGVFSFAENARRFSVPEREGGNGLPFRTIGQTDARNPVRNKTIGFERSTRLWVSAKYQDRGSPVTLASGVEARLIEAEAALRAGNLVVYLAKLNEARANAETYSFAPPIENTTSRPGPILAPPATEAEQVDLLFRERAINLFLTGTRLGDLRRLVRQYGRPQDTVFPTGNYPRPAVGGVYGNDVNFPIPFEENNNQNPEGKTCLNREA